jgi:hypothetical protein
VTRKINRIEIYQSTLYACTENVTKDPFISYNYDQIKIKEK